MLKRGLAISIISVAVAASRFVAPWWKRWRANILQTRHRRVSFIWSMSLPDGEYPDRILSKRTSLRLIWLISFLVYSGKIDLIGQHLDAALFCSRYLLSRPLSKTV